MNEEVLYFGTMFYYSNGKPKVFNDKVNNVISFWDEKGRLRRQIAYKDGKPNGEYSVWYANGVLKERGFYKHGELDGEYKEWNGRGECIYHVTYKDGELVKGDIIV